MHRFPGALILIAVMVLALSCLPSNSPAQTKKQPIRQDAELVVRTTALGLGGILSKVPERDDQILMIRDYIHPIRFFPDDSGYFFVLDMNGLCVAHAGQPELEGSDMLDYRDVKGFLVVRAMLEKARTGGGFVEYSWEKPGSDGFFQKLGYVEPIPGTDYVIGTGVYFPEPW